jgi:hypothetical protein
MKKLAIASVLCGSIMLITALIFATPRLVINSETNCCSIIVEKLDSTSNYVTYKDNSGLNNDFGIFVEVEYPEELISDVEQLQILTEEAINTMQEHCYHNHYVNN